MLEKVLSPYRSAVCRIAAHSSGGAQGGPTHRGSRADPENVNGVNGKESEGVTLGDVKSIGGLS